MEEITIEIDVLKDKKASIQISILNVFGYGRWPSDIEFLNMKTQIDELGKIQSQIDILEDVLLSIRENIKLVKNC